MRIPALLVLLLAAAPAAAAPAVASPGAADVLRSRSMAMGGAFRAVASSNDAIFLNPAGLAIHPRYAIDGHYALNPESDLRLWSVSVADSKTSPLAAGVAYSSIRGTGLEGATKGSVSHLGIGVPLAGVGSFGLSGKYLSFESPDRTDAITADVGLLLRLFGRLSAGAVVHNVIDVKSDEAPLSAGFGLAYGDDFSWRLATDVTVDLSAEASTPATVHAGGEYLLGGTVPLRLGFRRDTEAGLNHVSGGLGFVTPTFGADLAYVQGLDPDVPADRTFAITIQLFM